RSPALTGADGLSSAIKANESSSSSLSTLRLGALGFEAARGFGAVNAEGFLVPGMVNVFLGFIAVCGERRSIVSGLVSVRIPLINDSNSSSSSIDMIGVALEISAFFGTANELDPVLLTEVNAAVYISFAPVGLDVKL